MISKSDRNLEQHQAMFCGHPLQEVHPDNTMHGMNDCAWDLNSLSQSSHHAVVSGSKCWCTGGFFGYHMDPNINLLMAVEDRHMEGY